MVLKSTYRGFVAPVFTPFDEEGQLNLPEVSKYAQYLFSKKVDGILVNGTTGEAGQLSQDERKKLAQAWIDASKTTGQKIMIQVGGTTLSNVVELAKHAEAIGAWAILCLPELYIRPKTIEELIDYLKIVGAAAPNTPLFYYHFPALTGVTLDMVKFLDTAYSEIPTLSGLKYTHFNLDESARCIELRDRVFAVFLSNDQLLPAAFSMGFDCMVLTILNFAANEVFTVKRNIEADQNGALNAQKIQIRIRDVIDFILQIGANKYTGLKAIAALMTNLNLGTTRQPLKPITPDQLSKLETYLRKFNWLQ